MFSIFGKKRVNPDSILSSAIYTSIILNRNIFFSRPIDQDINDQIFFKSLLTVHFATYFRAIYCLYGGKPHELEEYDLLALKALERTAEEINDLGKRLGISVSYVAKRMSMEFDVFEEYKLAGRGNTGIVNSYSFRIWNDFIRIELENLVNIPDESKRNLYIMCKHEVSREVSKLESYFN